MHIVKSHGRSTRRLCSHNNDKTQILTSCLQRRHCKPQGGRLRKLLETKVEMFPQNKNSGFNLLNLYLIHTIDNKRPDIYYTNVFE